MIAKIIAFISVYLLTIFNFFIFLSPLTFFIIGRMMVNVDVGDNYIKTIIFLVISLINFLMLLFLFFDFLFSYSVRKLKKGCKNCEKDKDFLAIAEIFRDVKRKFGVKNVKLYISPSSEVNAYAVGSLRKKIIIITSGLLNKYSMSTDDRNKFLIEIKGIIGHEMSHLVNHDYFTALLLIVNERAVDFISNIILFIFNLFIRLFIVIPFIGSYLVSLIHLIYNIFNTIIHFTYNYIIKPIYNFIQLQTSKSIEYRADRQGGMVVGGVYMAEALSVLGSSGYFSIFSTHPTTKSRVKKVQDVEIKERIRGLISSRLLPMFSILIMIYICYLFYKMADIDVIVRDYNNLLNYTINKIQELKLFITNLRINE